MVGLDLGQPAFLVVGDTALLLEPIDHFSFWEFLTMALMISSNCGLGDKTPLVLTIALESLALEAISELISKILFLK